MADRVQGHLTPTRIPLALAGGLLLGLAHPGLSVLEPLVGPSLAFPGVALLFLALVGSLDARSAFATGWIAGATHFAVTLHWMVYPFLIRGDGHVWLLPLVILLVPAGFGLFWALAFALARFAAPGQGFFLAVAFAVSLAALEWLRGSVLTGFPWAMPGHVWIETGASILYPAFGTHALTLLTLLAPALAVAGIPGQKGMLRSATRFLAGLLLCALVSAAAFQSARLLRPEAFAPPEDATRPVLRLVQPNIPQREKWPPEFRARNFDRLRSLSQPTGAEGADVVIWPEAAVPRLLARGEAEARRLHAEVVPEAGRDTLLLLGALTEDAGESRAYNSLLALAPGTGLAAIYDKHHLVPFGEYLPFSRVLESVGLEALAGGGFRPGTGPTVLAPAGLPAFVPVICYEIIFAAEMRKVAAEASWLLHVTNDAWFGPDAGPKQHMALARIRAAEFGMPLVRVANTGVTAMVDADGQVIEALPMGEAGALQARLPPDPPGITPYLFWGDAVFLFLLVVGLLLVVAARLVRRLVDPRPPGAGWR